jgi:hypothetical protein
MSAATMLAPASVADDTPAIALAPRAWQDTRWVGQVSGQATTQDVLDWPAWRVRRRLSVVQVRHLVEAALFLPPVPPAALLSDAEPNGGGLSPTRKAVLEGLRADPGVPITWGELAMLAEQACCACGLQSLPTICAECPNLQLLTAVLRRRDSRAA